MAEKDDIIPIQIFAVHASTDRQLIDAIRLLRAELQERRRQRAAVKYLKRRGLEVKGFGVVSKIK